MKITFILPEVGLGGGVKVAFEYANHLRRKGHDVSIVYPLIPMGNSEKLLDINRLFEQILGTIKNYNQGIYVDWFDLKTNLIRAPIISEKYIPDADVIVATWWKTAYYVRGFCKTKGEKYYLIQHYEIWGGPKEKVENSYRLGLHNIVISTWLENKLQTLKTPIEAKILNGVDFQEFYPGKIERKTDKIKILMPYRRENWKGIEDGLKSFKIVKNKYNNINLVMFGPRPRKGEIPDEVEFHTRPKRDELTKIYNSCDIFCFPSRVEGFGLPPMEAMACKLPVVTTNVGAVLDYTIPGETALVSQPEDIETFAKNIIELIGDEQKREKIAEQGFNYIKQFTWERSADQIETIFKRHSKCEK